MAKPWAKAFYNSAAWRDTREAYMVSKHGLCERCGKPGLIVHHRKALRPQDMNDPARTLGWSNLELLCHHCHDIEHMAKHNGARCGFDDDGNLLPHSSRGADRRKTAPPTQISPSDGCRRGVVERRCGMGKPKAETRIKREREKLAEVFAKMDEDKRKTAEKLMDNAAFMGRNSGGFTGFHQRKRLCVRVPERRKSARHEKVSGGRSVQHDDQKLHHGHQDAVRPAAGVQRGNECPD